MGKPGQRGQRGGKSSAANQVKEAERFIAEHREIMEDPKLEYLVSCAAINSIADRHQTLSKEIQRASKDPRYGAGKMKDRMQAFAMLGEFFNEATALHYAKFPEYLEAGEPAQDEDPIPEKSREMVFDVPIPPGVSPDTPGGFFSRLKKHFESFSPSETPSFAQPEIHTVKHGQWARLALTLESEARLTNAVAWFSHSVVPTCPHLCLVQDPTQPKSPTALILEAAISESTRTGPYDLRGISATVEGGARDGENVLLNRVPKLSLLVCDKFGSPTPSLDPKDPKVSTARWRVNTDY